MDIGVILEYDFLTRSNTLVFANDRVGLREIQLTVCTLNETAVTVEAQAAVVQTTSAERSGVAF